MTALVLIAFAAVYLVWGSTYLAIQIGIESFPPLLLAGFRHLCAGLILYPILRWKTGIRPTAGHWKTAVVTGFLLLFVGNGGVSWAEQTVPSGVAALLVATVSLWLVILDWLRPGGIRPVPRVVVGILLGFCGLVLLVGPAHLGGSERVDPGGAGILVIASLGWAQVRMIGQAPVVGTTVFDMASDGDTFRVSIPSKHKFLTGPVAVEKNSSKPIENLRPQHLLDALLWPEVRKEEASFVREFNDENARYYVLSVLRGGYQTEVLREIWFDRTDLQVARLQTFGPKGVLLSDVRLSDWQPLEGAASQGAPPTRANGASAFPRAIRIDRPHDDYKLDLQVTKIVLNEDLPADRFKLEQPAGSDLVHVGDATENKQP